jgi:hypothetical protein
MEIRMLGLTKLQFNLIALAGSLASILGLALYFWPTNPSTESKSPVTASGTNSIAVGTMSGGTIAPPAAPLGASQALPSTTAQK